MNKSFRILIVLCFASPFISKANFDFNSNCLNAYNNVFDFKLATAQALINNEKKSKPNNSIIPLIENYIDYFTLLSSESKSQFDQLKGKKSARLSQISNDNDRSSPYFLYAQAEINLQWALIRGRYGEYFNAAMEIKKANSLLVENVKKFPNFQLNYKGLGLINAVLGNLPDGTLKSTLATFGIKGNLQVGLNMFEKLAQDLPGSALSPFYDEVIFYYSYVLNDVAHSNLAYAKTMKYTSSISDSSLLKTYLRAYVAVKNSHNDEAIAILEKRPIGKFYQPFPYLDYLEGTAKLNKLDFSAVNDFNKFLIENKGVNYIKDTNLRLAWIALLKGDRALYTKYLGKVNNDGFTYQEKDKQAVQEADAPQSPLELLKARLLFDGGYYAKALSVLDGKSLNDYTSNKDKVEFSYRVARIYDSLGKDDQALGFYQNAINLGKNMTYFYASNAALQMGKIFELKKDTVKAKLAYNTAIGMKNHDYENSIETQAKSALKRIK